MSTSPFIHQSVCRSKKVTAVAQQQQQLDGRADVAVAPGLAITFHHTGDHRLHYELPCHVHIMIIIIISALYVMYNTACRCMRMQVSHSSALRCRQQGDATCSDVSLHPAAQQAIVASTCHAYCHAGAATSPQHDNMPVLPYLPLASERVCRHWRNIRQRLVVPPRRRPSCVSKHSTP